MAANFHLSVFILLIVSAIPQFCSQSTSPQNIQTFYPFPPTPPPPPPVIFPEPVNDPPPTTVTPPPSPPSRSSSTRAAVGRAIGVTAASTLVLSGLLFFLLQRHSKRRKRERNSAAATQGGGTNNHPFVPQNDSFVRFDGNVKGLIVDENGLDVLYWRKLEDNRSSFKKEYYKNSKDDGGEERDEKRIVAVDGEVQEVPLLRGKSSTSQSKIWAENDDYVTKKDSSVQMMKFSAPPLTLQPGKQPLSSFLSPAAPPPPTLAVGSLSKGKMAATPPPPPMPSKNGSTSSLKPPAPTGKRSASAGEGVSKNGNEQMKLKPLHWDKVNPNVDHSMVWDKMDKGSFKFDGDLMEALFGYVATNRKSPQRDGRSASPIGDKSGPPAHIFILDTRKSQNTAIVIKSLGVSRQEIIDALVEGQGLNADTIEKLTRIAPTDEEASQILAFKGDPTRLADAESFLYHLLKVVPSAFARFNAMHFRSNYDTEVSHIKESLKSLESACNELRTRGLFLKLLEAVLKAGNRLNAGTSRGNAQAFNIAALRKLSDVKSSDGKTTLLQFVVQEVVRAEGKRCVVNRTRNMSRTSSQSSNSGSQSSDPSKDDREREYMMLGLPVIGGLSTEFSNVKKAAVLDYELLVKTISELSAQVVDVRKVVADCGTDGGFAHGMKGFLDTAELEMVVLKEEQTRVMELVQKTTDYYQAGGFSTGENPLQLFVIVRDFLGMVDQVCIDIARNVQKRKHGSSPVDGSSSPESPRIFRFPKLPANFMSDYSKSSSTDDNG